MLSNPIPPRSLMQFWILFFLIIDQKHSSGTFKKPLRYFKSFIVFHSDAPSSGTFCSDGNVLYVCLIRQPLATYDC